jgi:hypothetical protein
LVATAPDDSRLLMYGAAELPTMEPYEVFSIIITTTWSAARNEAACAVSTLGA